MATRLNIPPVTVGELHHENRFGQTETPVRIIFSGGDDPEGDTNEGDAFAEEDSCIYGYAQYPVFRSNGERLRIPGYSGLACKYDAGRGTLEDFECEEF